MPVTAGNVLMALGYATVLAATVPKLAAQDELSWHTGAFLLLVIAHSLSITKSLSPTYEQKKRVTRALLVVLLAYYTLAVMLPLPLHWYDVLVIMSLLVGDDYVAATLLVFYYLFSAAHYMDKQEALQVSGRTILLAVAASNVVSEYNKPSKTSASTT